MVFKLSKEHKARIIFVNYIKNLNYLISIKNGYNDRVSFFFISRISSAINKIISKSYDIYNDFYVRH